MKGWVSHAANAVLVLCAVLVTGLVIRREVAGPQAPPPAAGEFEPDWRAYAAEGHRAGPAEAPVTVVVFSDFQCPACASFAETLRDFERGHPGKVATVYRHLPLPSHAFAVPAARAAECAARQGRFQEMHDALFAAQDSIGLRPFARFAEVAGVADADAFAACLDDPASEEAVQRDLRAAGDLGLSATPTLLVNGRRVRGAPSAARLEALVREASRDPR